MDPMDIDSIVYVPDTPDRLAARQTKFSSIDVPDSPDKPAAGDNFNGNTGRGSNDKDRNVIRANENGIRKPLMRPPRRHHGDSSAGAALGNSFSKSSIVSKRHEPSHNQCAKSEKIQNSISYDPREGSIEDLTGQHCHGNKGKKAISLGGIQIIENGRRLLSDKGEKAVSAGGSKTGEKGKNFVSAAQLHSHQNVADCRLVSRINNGKGISNSVSALDRGKGVDSNTLTPPKVGQLDSTSFSSPRNTGQKRLVRNGCISPSNVANAQKDFGKANNGSIDVGPSHVSSSRTQARVHTNVPLADTQASNVSKGKGIIPLLNEEPGGQNANDSGSVSINEILEEDEDCNRGSILGGWRNTHNRSRNTCPSSSEEHQFPPVGHSSVLSSSESPLPLIERLNVLRARSNPHNGDHLGTTGMIRKRQKQGSSSSIQDVRSQNTSADSGTPFLGPSAVTIESRTTRSRRRSNHVDNIERVIEIDEGNSGDRNNGSNGASSSSSVDVAMARQMEADEMLARELQEQLYHEDLGVRFGEVNVHERPDLEHENVQNALPRRTRQASTARTVPTASASRPPRARPNTNITRAGYETRISFHNRMNRLRNRFPGRSRTASSSREGSSLFPPEMDVDLRMSILEALEAFDDMGVDNNLLDIHREFNENDYEMLLGLDDNNHTHSGTSANRINNLPQTTLENDNLEEACAICLETPTTGDTIRHLPCFHMFHKDCIDPWLRRKSSCPVCKHSVT